MGTAYTYSTHSDFDCLPANGWDEGISLFRVPVTRPPQYFFGDHSDDPAIYYDHAEFVAATQPVIDGIKAKKGIFILYAHHYGDEFDCHATTWGYGFGGVTPTDLEWMIDLIRANNGIVKTFSEAVAYYRSYTDMYERNGDLIWAPGPIADVDPSPSTMSPGVVTSYPNPFNPRATLNISVPSDGHTVLEIYDIRGRHLISLVSGYLPRGHYEFGWDGCDATGKHMPSGVYFVQLVQAGTVATEKISLLR
ncbi:MAG: T9SS type A sorting domain-containing protein [bacterium]